MAFYEIDHAPVPWGDYGHILFFGMSERLPRRDGLIQLERTGPFVPPITFPRLGLLVVTDLLRILLEKSDLTGFVFKPVIKARIVESHWHTWDRALPEPAEYTVGGEPEGYILEKPHSAMLSRALGKLWELVPEVGGTVEWKPRGDGALQEDALLTSPGSTDIFRPDGCGYVFVGQRGKEWLDHAVGEWLKFTKATG